MLDSVDELVLFFNYNSAVVVDGDVGDVPISLAAVPGKGVIKGGDGLCVFREGSNSGRGVTCEDADN